MATHDSTLAPNGAAPFRSGYEGCCLPGVPGSADQPTAALQINPHASPIAIAAAALSRADLLHKALDAWSTVRSGCVDAAEVAQTLEPTAEEVRMLLSELVTQLHRAATNGPQLMTAEAAHV